MGFCNWSLCGKQVKITMMYFEVQEASSSPVLKAESTLSGVKILCGVTYIAIWFKNYIYATYNITI